MKIPREGRFFSTRPAVHTETLVLAAALYLLVAGNAPFWRALLAGRALAEPATWWFAGAVFTMLAAFYVAFTAIFANRYTVRPLLALLLVVTAAASYYMERYGVFLDRNMVRNMLATNYKEAAELIGWGVAGHVFVFGLLPAGLLWWPRLDRRHFRRAVVVRMAWIAGAFAISAASLMLVFGDLASVMRNHREMRFLITPGNVVASLIGETFGRTDTAGMKRMPVGADAKPAPANARRPSLFVLVVGETARARNFSLNGYARDTNPMLAARGVIAFTDATACGTSTEVSLPCMFSVFGRRHYDEDKILSHESVLHVLARAGVGVLWRDNQSGCKGVCEGLPQEQLDRAGGPPLCVAGQCFDEVLLQGLDGIVRSRSGDLLIVLHQLGNHGPSYYKRYPPAFAQFSPACASDDLRSCSQEQIVNAYDNAILYTDSVLARLVDFLSQAQATHDTAMLYVSDHGESLGEKGLYLHGVPWAIAPSEQTHVPFVLWLSQPAREHKGIAQACLKAQASRPVSHDNLFHSLLGYFDVRTSAYDPSLDIFADCRRAPVAVGAASAPAR